MKNEKHILFLCTANSCRSQIAEGWARHLVPKDFVFYSAGIIATGIHPMVVRVMQEAGVDLSSQRSKMLDQVPLDKIDVLITLCGNAAEACPTFPRPVEHLHWPIKDPVGAEGSEDEKLRAFRRTRDEIRQRLETYLAASL